jgi:hypothetical protein
MSFFFKLWHWSSRGAIYLSIHPSVNRPIICLSCIYPSICLSIHHYVSVYLYLFASIHFLSTCLTFYSFIYPSIYLRVSLCLHLSIPTQNLNFFYLLACTTFEKQHTFCQQSTPKQQNSNMSTARNTVTRVLTSIRNWHVTLYLYPPGSFRKYFSSLHFTVCCMHLWN